MDFAGALQKVDGLRRNIQTVIVGKTKVVDLAITCLIAEGHLLIEDVPGVGKSMLAKAMARSISTLTKRIQFTPDLLPSDVTGSNFYNEKEHNFVFRPGPIFANVILADEINRATPRTQSSLLEAMEETQVTVDGETHPLPRPFFVIGTQNPVEFDGTYPLPISQMDRFMIRTEFGYLDRKDEVRMLQDRKERSPLDALVPVMTAEDVMAVQAVVRSVRVETPIYGYLVDLVAATRNPEQFALGASPRTALRLFRASQARAVMQNRDFVIPDDVKAIARSVLGHRVIPRSALPFRGPGNNGALDDVLGRVPAPF